MRAVVQRVAEASVRVDGKLAGQIGNGLLVLLGVATGDSESEAKLLANKVTGLRIFEDAEGKMNLDLAAIGGAVLAISQFTLLGDAGQGRRPSFINAARPETAKPLFDHFVASIRTAGFDCQTGIFGADMKVALVNDGPVTILLDTEKPAQAQAKG